MTVAVLIPVLARPHRVEPLATSLAASVTVTQCNAVFVCSPNDHDEIAAVRAAGLEPLIATWYPGRGDYAMKMNLGFRETTTPWVFLAADDLDFGKGWADQAIHTHHRTGCCVIGTNDLGNARVKSGRHSTHSLVHRDYQDCGTIDEGDKILCELYDHQYVDDEFIQTAKVRRTFAFSQDAIVEHLHPHWGKAPMDSTYEKGQREFWADKALFEQRQPLWLRGSVGTW